MLCTWYIFTDNLASIDALVKLSRQLTIAPDYLLKSSLLTRNTEQVSDRNNTAFHWREPSWCEGSRKMAQVCTSSTQNGRNVTFAKIENDLLTSPLASSLTENRLLKQLEIRNIGQKMSQLCVAPSLILSTKETSRGACSTAVVSSVPNEITSTVLECKSIKKQQKIKRKAYEAKGKSVIGKPKLKHMKKLKVAVPEQVDKNDEVDSSFELPNYELMHECMANERTELFIPFIKEEMVEQLVRPVDDIPSLKVVT